jgi:hypothetical protein
MGPPLHPGGPAAPHREPPTSLAPPTFNAISSDEREAAAKARLDAYITRAVEAAPPLTPEQRARLAVLLAPPLVGSAEPLSIP